MENTNQTILVTGGLGYIGSHTVVELILSGHNVIIIDNLCNSSQNVLQKIEEITQSCPLFFNLDVTNYSELNNIFNLHKIDSVIHFAAHKAVGESVQNPLKYYENNLVSTLNILKCISQHNTKNLIFSSSATVYGDSKEQPISESSPVQQPTNPYGNTKKISEEIIADFCAVHKEKQAISLRYFNPIGAHKSAKIGENPNGIPTNLLPYITQTARGLRKVITIFGKNYPTPDGTGVRDYIHVVDLAKAHVAAVNFLAQEKTTLKNYYAINIGTGKGYSVLEIIKAFEKENNIKLNYQFGERRSGDVATCYADPKLAHSLLNWKAQLSLGDMVKSAWLYEQQKLNS